MLAYYTNELYHHGILGQKWGVRRYQNADGTRTAAGKIRAANYSDKQYICRTNVYMAEVGLSA